MRVCVVLVALWGILGAQTISRYDLLVDRKEREYAEVFNEWINLKRNVVTANGERNKREKEAWVRVCRKWEEFRLAVDSE